VSDTVGVQQSAEVILNSDKSTTRVILPQTRRIITSNDFTVYLSFHTNDPADIEFSLDFEPVLEILNRIRHHSSIFRASVHFQANR
jgi:hypothetical protein